MDGRHAVIARSLKVRRRGRRHRQMRERSVLRVHQRREELQIITERRTCRELTQPRRAPRKYRLAVGQTDAGYRRLREGFDLTRFEDSLRHWASLGACLGLLREPRWQGEGADARRAAPPVVGTTGKPCNAADAPLLANPSGPGRFPLMRRCRLLIGSLPNCVGSALPEGKSAAVAAT